MLLKTGVLGVISLISHLAFTAYASQEALVTQDQTQIMQDQAQMLEKNLGTIPNSIKTEWHEEGFKDTSELIFKSFFKNRPPFVIPEYELTIPLIATIKLKGIRFVGDWTGVQIKPQDNDTLGLEIDARKMKITIDETVVQNYFVPWFQSVCSTTSILLGDKNASPHISSQLQLSIDSLTSKVASNLKDTQLILPEDSFHGKAPERCVGTFGQESFLTTWGIGLVITYAKSIILNQIEKSLSLMGDVLNNEINQAAHLDVAIDLEKQLVLPETKILLSFYPSAVKITDKTLTFQLGTHFKALSKEETFDIRRKRTDFESKIKKDPHPQLVKMASLGIHPSFINKFLEVMYLKPGPKYRIDGYTHHMMGQILKASELKMFWPDLENQTLDTDDMQAFLQVTTPPFIKTNINENKLSFIVPKFQASFQVYQNKKWRDYFNLSSTIFLTSTFEEEVPPSYVAINLTGGFKEMSGSWPSNAVPMNSIFEKDLAMQMFSDMLAMGCDQINPIKGQFPFFYQSGKPLTMSHFRVDKSDSYLKLDLMSLK